MIRIDINPIYPKPTDYPVNLVPKIDSAIYNALVGPIFNRLRSALNKRVMTWEGRPIFAKRYRRPTVDSFELTVFPSGDAKIVRIYKWVSLGTEGYPIRVKNAPVLKWRRYYARTAPGNRYGMRARYYGQWHSAVEVWHTGIAPRDFEGHVVDEEGKKISRDIQFAVDWTLARN